MTGGYDTSPRTFSDTMPPESSATTALLKTRIAEFIRARSMALRTCRNKGKQRENVEVQFLFRIYLAQIRPRRRKYLLFVLSINAVQHPLHFVMNRSDMRIHKIQIRTPQVGVTYRSCVGEERELHALLDVLLEDRESSVRHRKIKTRKKSGGAAVTWCFAKLSHADVESQLTPQRTQTKPSK